MAPKEQRRGRRIGRNPLCGLCPASAAARGGEGEVQTAVGKESAPVESARAVEAAADLSPGGDSWFARLGGPPRREVEAVPQEEPVYSARLFRPPAAAEEGAVVSNDAPRCPRRDREIALDDMREVRLCREVERVEPEREVERGPDPEEKRSRRQRKAEAQMLAAAKRGDNPTAGSIGVLRNLPEWNMPRKYVALRVAGGEKRVKKTAMKVALSVEGLRGKTAVQGHTARGSVAVSVKSINSVMQGGTEAGAALDVARHSYMRPIVLESAVALERGDGESLSERVRGNSVG